MVFKIGVQIVGQSLVAALAYGWLGIGVGSYAQIALNVGVGLVIVLALSWLDAFGLGRPKNWLWCVPAVLLLGLFFWKLSAALVVIPLWLMVIFPSAVAGRWRVYFELRYLASAVAILAMSFLPAVALVMWKPPVQGLGLEMASLGIRLGMAALFFYGGWGLLLDFAGRQTAPPEAQHPIATVAPEEGLHA